MTPSPSFTALAVAALSLGCSSTTTSTGTADAQDATTAIDAATTADVSADTADNDTASEVADATAFSVPEASSFGDAPPPLPASPTFACVDAGTVVATLALDATTGEAGPSDPACPLPPSVCSADPQWLVYYSDGTCIDGTCHFTVHEMKCDTVCSSGGCGIPFTH